jgi:hypothetical protein
MCRQSGNRKHTTVSEHMPSSHRCYAGWTIERIREDARNIGLATEWLCEQSSRFGPIPSRAIGPVSTLSVSPTLLAHCASTCCRAPCDSASSAVGIVPQRLRNAVMVGRLEGVCPVR